MSIKEILRPSISRPATLPPLAVALVLIASLLLPVLALVQRALAESDTTPMSLVDLQVADPNVDVSAGVDGTEMVGEIFEELSGFQSVTYVYTSPSGNQIIEGDANSDPQFINQEITFPQYAEAGVWRPTITLTDQASNVRVYTPVELQGLGFLVDITVTSSPADTTVPSLDAMTYNVSTVDTASSSGVFTASATISDDLSGFRLGSSFALFTSSSANQRVGGTISHVSGDDYNITATFPQYSEVGNWTMEITLTDNVSNTIIMDATDLAGASLPNTVNITGNSDVTPATIDSFDFTAAFPPVGDIISNSAKVTLYAEFSDNLSGVGEADLIYRSQTSTQTAPAIPVEDGDVTQYTVFIPPFAASGEWHPELTLSDLAGNQVVYDENDLSNLGYNLIIDLITHESENVAENGTVTTDPENDGATPTEPFEASVTSPVAGDVTITQLDLVDPVSTNDFNVFNQQYDIAAPTATAESPLILTFNIDAGSLEGQTASTVEVFRNSVLVEDCAHPTEAVPDPCVAERNTLGDGDVELVVRTSEASIWFLGYSTEEEGYDFLGFHNPTKNAPNLNSRKAGSTAPIKFDLGGDQGMEVLPASVGSSQRINCTTFEAMGDSSPINLVGGGLSYDTSDELYRFNWKTLKAWDDTCRQLILEFSSGETVHAYFEFN